MSEVIRSAWSNAKINEDFICIDTYSGYRSSHRDSKGKQYLIMTDVSDEILGAALLETLACSRFVLPQDDIALYDHKQGLERYGEWVKALMDRYHYKTKRALFKNMKNCSIKKQGELITISPSHHEKLEAWGREKNDGIEDVVISADSSSAEIGAALRLAFSRCT